MRSLVSIQRPSYKPSGIQDAQVRMGFVSGRKSLLGGTRLAREETPVEAGVTGAAVPRRFEDLVIVRKMKNRELFGRMIQKVPYFLLALAVFVPTCAQQKNTQYAGGKRSFSL